MPSIEEKVIRTPGKPRKFHKTLTFFPGDEQNLRDADVITSIPEHHDPNGGGYFRPDPDNEGVFMCVYLEYVGVDDSDPSAKKRHTVEVEIPGGSFRQE